MSRSKSIAMYEYTKPTWDAVYEMSRREPDHEITIDQAFESTTERIKFSLDMHSYRVCLQKINAALYPKGHPNHGTSLFDQFKIVNATDEDGHLVLKVRKRGSTKPVKISAGKSEITLDITSSNSNE